MSTEKHSPEDTALSLTSAIVRSSPAPLLLLDGQCNIIAAITSFCSVFGVYALDVTGQPHFALNNGTWDIAELRSYLTATLYGEGRPAARDIGLQQPQQPVRRLILQASRLTYRDLEQAHILVAISDVTHARADAALKEQSDRANHILLQEVRHWVMSGAALEGLLATSEHGDFDEIALIVKGGAAWSTLGCRQA